MSRPSPPPGTAVLIPVKAFSQAKRRLADALSPTERATLARRMATGVVAAAAPLHVAVVCDDDEVATWATSAGAEVLWRPGLGLDAAVADGVETLGMAGWGRVVVSHGDLPLARELGWVAAFPGITIVPDRRDDGTNVICVPTGAGFAFAYGPGSFRRHGAEARRIGHGLRVVRDRLLGWDVDLPADLAHPGIVG